MMRRAAAKWVVMARLSLCMISLSLPLASGAEGIDSDLVIEIGHIGQPYNCTLFLDNLEVRRALNTLLSTKNLKQKISR